MRRMFPMMFLCLSLSLAACAGEVYVPDAPPPPQTEVVGTPPYADGVWIGGYYEWVGGRHIWRAGHWEHGRPGYVYQPHTWARRGNGYVMVRGGWRRR